MIKQSIYTICMWIAIQMLPRNIRSTYLRIIDEGTASIEDSLKRGDTFGVATISWGIDVMDELVAKNVEGDMQALLKRFRNLRDKISDYEQNLS